MTEYETTTLSLIVKPKGDLIYSNHATIVEMMDEGGGPFIRIFQPSDDNERGQIKIDRDEWGAIKEATQTMLEICREQQEIVDIKEGKAK